MTTPLLILILLFQLTLLTLAILLLRKKTTVDPQPFATLLQPLLDAAPKLEQQIRADFAQYRQEAAATERQARAELAQSLLTLTQSLNTQLTALTDTNSQKLAQQHAAVDARLQLIQTENTNTGKTLRQETGDLLKAFNDSILKTMHTLGTTQQEQFAAFALQLAKLTETNQAKLDELRLSVEAKLQLLREDNGKQLDLLRATVDEKLQSTLEKRLSESFKLVSDRLELVHKGLGEMQTLATGVGDLKKVLTNVKTRGTWGEMQLGALLAEVLTPEQYDTNVATKDTLARVEFAIRLPGQQTASANTDHGNDDGTVWLPIDSKWPEEDYHRLLDAQDQADPALVEAAIKQLEIRIKSEARDICEKYLNPPKTTDFAILFLPTEGLFAEVVRRSGLVTQIQHDCHVIIAGPTTLWSILNSLQMGFRTLAIQQRSSEVWNLLAAVKAEWTKYGDILAKVQKKLQEASNTVDEATRRTRVIGRKLSAVQELPTKDPASLPPSPLLPPMEDLPEETS